jgi:hypothetical protein
MTNKIELQSKSNWINWDLYSEKALSKEEQISNLNHIRENIQNHILKSGTKGQTYLLDIRLYSDSNNDRLFKLIGTVGSISSSEKTLADEAIKNRHDYFITGGEKALALGGIHPPPPPPGYLNRTSFSRIFDDMNVGPAISSIFSVK